MSGTGTTSTGGNDDCAEPCRPSIQATATRANSGTSPHGTPAEVIAGPPSAATSVSLFFDIKDPPSGFDRGGLTNRATRFVAKWPHPLAGTTLPGKAGW